MNDSPEDVGEARGAGGGGLSPGVRHGGRTVGGVGLQQTLGTPSVIPSTPTQIYSSNNRINLLLLDDY